MEAVKIHALTLDELYDEIKIARKAGLGKKKILLSNDDEGNGYHICFYSVTEIEDSEMMLKYGMLPFSVNKDNIGDYVLLG